MLEIITLEQGRLIEINILLSELENTIIIDSIASKIKKRVL